MSDSTDAAGVAGRYAKALFEIADESGSLDAVEGALGQMKDALAVSNDLAGLIKSPIVSREDQLSLIHI